MPGSKERTELISGYLNGSILEMLERVKALKTKIPSATLPDSHYQVASTCIKDIDEVISGLEELIHNQKYQVKSNLSRKVVDFQNQVTYIEYLENKIVAPLQRVNKDDIKASGFVKKICKEINFPLLPPVVSRLSQEYYSIDVKYNYMRAPLLESEFLLHLPDIYHELCHSIISADNHPSTEKFLEQLSNFIDIAESYCSKHITGYKKNGAREEAQLLGVCSKSWIQWAIELFCDLYGTYTVGPAFSWANLHLCMKKGGNAFKTPLISPSVHPANNARMMAILAALELMGLKKESQEIKIYWDEYLHLTKSTIDARYKIAFPNVLIEQAAAFAFNGTKGIKANIYKADEQGTIRALLNEAWRKFIIDPIDYLAWEKLKREESAL